MSEITMVPRVSLAGGQALQPLEKQILQQQAAIEAWFSQQWQQTRPPLYCSVDLRNAGDKLAPVDTNLFPAGFNNLNLDFLPLCSQAVSRLLQQLHPQAKNLVIIPESHTRNLFYLESVVRLQTVFQQAGYQVQIGSLSPDVVEPMTITLPSANTINLAPLQRDGNRLFVEGKLADVVILNNDLSGTVPAILAGIEQPMMPPLGLGWSSRLKSAHFGVYLQVTTAFAEKFGFDPWLITPLFRNCGKVRFMDREGEDCLFANATKLLAAIKDKYQQYNIQRQPFIVAKADAGSYGMGVISVTSAEQLVNLNRKQRTKMATTKGGQQVSQVILQEGVYTQETWGESQATAEPVVYMMGKQVVGGFYRVHEKKSASENLNATGARFEPLAFVDETQPEQALLADRFYSYSVVARLALVAAARELEGVLCA